MIPKGFVIPVLLVGMMFLSVIGCGSDVEELEEPIVEPSVPSSSNEELLGSWDVVSIFRKTPEAFFGPTENEEEFAGAETKVIEFHCTFADDNSWVWNFRQEMVFKDEADIPLGTVEMTGTWSGIYSVKASTFSFILKASDTGVKSEPQGFFETLVGLTEEEIKRRLVEGFRFEVFARINQSTITRHEDTLTLMISAERKIIFEKR